jgi:hypothetical protein
VGAAGATPFSEAAGAPREMVSGARARCCRAGTAPGMRSPSAVMRPSPQVYMKALILGSTTWGGKVGGT